MAIVGKQRQTIELMELAVHFALEDLEKRV